MNYDVVIIGSGPGGYVAAIRCAQLGMKTALVEKYPTLGGTCLNVGCIPSKALLDSSEKYHSAQHDFAIHGINTSNLEFDWSKMLKRKSDVIAQTCDGIQYLMKKNKIEVHHGQGCFLSPTQIQVQSEGETKQLTTRFAIIATGSKPATLPFAQIDKKRIITSTEALSLPEVPQTMAVIGGGVIGLELGQVYSRLGSNVQVLEYADRILPTMDQDISKEMMRTFKKQGLAFFLKHSVQKIENQGDSVSISAIDHKDKEHQFEADYCLIAVGRKPYTEGLGLESIGVQTDKRGFISVNDKLQTSCEGVYAIGDVIGGAMLAHKGEEEGVFVAEHLDGQKPHLNYFTIPGVVYTHPEAAGIGYTEQELQDKGQPYKKGSFPFKALGRARAAEESAGFVKVLADQNTDEVLGVHMVGARVADIIAEAVVAMEYKASAEDIARICHPHPTFTEAVKEAALGAWNQQQLHL